MDFFDPERESLVNARDVVMHFTASAGATEAMLALPYRAIVTFSRRMLNGLVQLANGKRIDLWRGRNPRLFMTGRASHAVVLTVSTHGAPAAVMLLEELSAFGVKQILFVGYCASIQEEVGLGEVVLPMRAIREEGTSYHYLPSQDTSRPAGELVMHLSRWADRRGVVVRRGTVLTTDAVYRETRGKIEKYRAGGVLGVDMEMAAVFAVGAMLGVEVAGLLLISDQFSSRGWAPGFSHPVLLEKERLVSESLLEWMGQEGR